MKKINFKGVNSQTFFNIMSMAIRGAISSLTMPIFTRMLGTEQYGMYSIYLSWVGVFACFMGLQCGSSLATRYYKYDDYEEYKSGLFSFCLITCVIIILVCVLCLDLIEGVIELPKLVIIMMLFDSVTAFVISYAGMGWIYEKQAQKNMIVTIVNVVVGTTISIVLIYVWQTQDLYIARIIGLFIPAAMVSIVISIGIYKRGGFSLKAEYIKYGLGFGIPIIFHMLSQYILAQSDRVMMQKMNISMSDIGIYSFSYNFAFILSAILQAFGNAWSPFLFDGLKEEKYDETNTSLKNYVQLFTIICCGFLLVAKEFGTLFGGEQFVGGIILIPIFVLSVYCTFIYQFAVSYESYMERPRYIAIMTMIAATINIIFNYILIPLWGILGAAIATLIGYLFLAILHMIIVHIWKQKRFPLKKIYIAIGSLVIVSVSVLFYVLYEQWIVRWILAFIMGIYLVVSVVKRRKIF